MSQLTFLDQLLEARRPLSVSELTARIKILLEGQFLELWIEGEISNFRRHTSGHWYFTLKDEGAMLRCASFRMQNRLIRFTPEAGLMVRAHGRLSLYEARGEYQLIVEYMEPVGIGALQLGFEQLKRRLAAEGLFDMERKRQLPLLPRCIGIVTSPTGAAVRDILRVIRRRNEAMNVLIAPARVQELQSSRAFDDVHHEIRRAAQRFDEAVYAMETALRQRLKQQRTHLTGTALRLRDTDIRRATIERRRALDLLTQRLQASERMAIDGERERFAVASGKLHSLSPLAVLGRGYAIAFDAEGRIIKRADDIESGERIRVRVADGEMD